jgi:hypothetical protein
MGTREPSDPDAIRWRRVDELVSRALPLSRDERAQLLDRECAEDPALREEVESLLAGESRAGAFLDPAASPLRGLTPDPGQRAVEEDPSQDPWIGRRLGGFVLRQVIGSGGMGRVYEAWQERPGRGAAVKILRRGLRQPSDTRRFEHEASILGRLRHPCIAHLYEVGQVADPLGQGEEVPYLAMELIAGARPITR